MGKEVEMGEASKEKGDEGAAGPGAAKGKASEGSDHGVFADLKQIRVLVERAVAHREVRLMTRAIRLTMAARKKLTAVPVSSFARAFLPSDSETRSLILSSLSKAQSDMDMDSSSSIAPAAAATTGSTRPPSSVFPEIEALALLITLIYLIDRKAINEACELSSFAIGRLRRFNRRSLDPLFAKVVFYFSLSHERSNRLADIRSTLLELNQTATLRHDEIGQETLLNLLLRNYLHFNGYDQAEKLRSKIQRPESHSNQQFCRYLYYWGRIRTIQLEYSDAKECLQQAGRKAPTIARGFRIECAKWQALVRLLLGEIPERTLFMAPGMRRALRPYFQLTNAVRVGDLEFFHSIATQHIATFTRDRTQNLIVRLRHNVIRTGLRRISLAYSRISLENVSKKLHLQGPTATEDAECIVAKAIRDGGIDAVVSHAEGWMQSKESSDVYPSHEPQAAFHSRIAFCLNTHNEAIKAMRFPPGANKAEVESGEKRRERQQAEQELAEHMAEEADDDF